MFFGLTACLLITLAIAVLFAEKIYPAYKEERGNLIRNLNIAKRDIRWFRSTHSEDSIRHNSYFSNELKKLINERNSFRKEISRMKIEIIAVAVVCAVIVIAVWVFVLYKFVL